VQRPRFAFGRDVEDLTSVVLIDGHQQLAPDVLHIACRMSYNIPLMECRFTCRLPSAGCIHSCDTTWIAFSCTRLLNIASAGRLS
jgi:hypothetical protein